MINKLVKSILAGVSISIGATIYLLCANKIVGAFLFSIGILLVMEFKMLLYTGYVPTQRESQKFGDYIINSTFVFIGNLIGCAATALLLSLTRIKTDLSKAALNAVNTKLGTNFLGSDLITNIVSVFILSIFCGIIIAGIVKATNLKHKVLYVAMMIATFILCGFEHVVANAFYFSLNCKILTLEGLIFMLVCFAGNFVGGLLCSYVKSPEEKTQQ